MKSIPVAGRLRLHFLLLELTCLLSIPFSCLFLLAGRTKTFELLSHSFWSSDFRIPLPMVEQHPIPFSRSISSPLSLAP